MMQNVCVASIFSYFESFLFCLTILSSYFCLHIAAAVLLIIPSFKSRKCVLCASSLEATSASTKGPPSQNIDSTTSRSNSRGAAVSALSISEDQSGEAKVAA